MKNSIIISILATVICISSCQKEAEIITGNEAPPDYTIETIIARNFINKTYIGILGRKPTDLEFNSALNTLNSNNLSVESRKTVLNTVVSNQEFRPKVLADAKADYLRSITDADIDEMIFVYNFLKDDPANALFATLFTREIERLEKLKALPTILNSGDIEIREMHKILVNNHFYDDFNMGSENFVTSTFQTFLFRYPTNSELSNGVKMVDGFSAILFFKGGSNKNDYIDIFFQSDSYYEGRVRYLFNKYIFRNPTTEEFKKYSEIYKSNDNYAQLIVEILSIDDYIGI
jgi:hypothetical protein